MQRESLLFSFHFVLYIFYFFLPRVLDLAPSHVAKTLMAHFDGQRVGLV